MFLSLLKNIFLSSFGVVAGIILLFSIAGWIKRTMTNQDKKAAMHGLICAVIVFLAAIFGHFMIFNYSLLLGFGISLIMTLLIKKQKASKKGR